tara:strand:- start:37 stop:384 length:348 start_codon:yes stop_codon:yes gene_type:complete
MYKLLENSIQRLSDNACIPQAEGNTDYEQFVTDVGEQGLSIVEGETVISPDYVALRTGVDGYEQLSKQLEMQSDDLINTTTTWIDHVNSVKTAFPKSNTGSSSNADLPQWVKDLA